MKIFCIGYPRTGTKSITKAFKILGFKAWHFNRADYNETLEAVKTGVFSERILDNYDAFADVPMFLIYEGLDKIYPNSKFILVTRKKYSWFKSMNKMLSYAKRYQDYRRLNGIVWRSFCPETIEEHTKKVKKYFLNEDKRLLVVDLEEINFNILGSFLGIKTNKTGFCHV